MRITCGSGCLGPSESSGGFKRYLSRNASSLVRNGGPSNLSSRISLNALSTWAGRSPVNIRRRTST